MNKIDLVAAAQVVVDDETTAKDLLERGRLTRRVTIIPLNKVCDSDGGLQHECLPLFTLTSGLHWCGVEVACLKHTHLTHAHQCHPPFPDGG